MSDLILQTEFDKAVAELKGFFESKEKELNARGWTFSLSLDAPNSFKELKHTTVNKHILLGVEGCETSIYGLRHNCLFRFWHDVCHLELDAGFSHVDESVVIQQHLKEGREYGLSNLALRILHADTQGQVDYYYYNKGYVKNQENFIWTYLTKGSRYAIGMRL